MLKPQGQWLYRFQVDSRQYAARGGKKKLHTPCRLLPANRGSILIVALWSLFFLSALVLALNAFVNPQISLASKLKERARVYYLAKAGVKIAIAAVMNDGIIEDGMPKYDALSDLWSVNDEEFKEKDLGGGVFSVFRYPQTEYGLVDEERKININEAPVDALKRFFEIAASVPSDDASGIADSIIDWRDTDDNAREFGAENSYYQALSPSYLCKNKNFETIEELRLVRGINEEIFNKIKYSITVYGQGAVNINTADEPALESLGMSGPLAEKVIYFREGGDDNVFTDVSTIVDVLGRSENLSKEEISQLSNIAGSGLVTVTSDNFMGKSAGKLKNRSIVCGITFVFNRDKKIKYWKEEWE